MELLVYQRPNCVHTKCKIKQNRWSRPLWTPVFFSGRWTLGSLLKCTAASTCSADCVLVSQRSLEWAGTEYPPGPEHRVDGWTVLIRWRQSCQLFCVFSFLFTLVRILLMCLSLASHLEAYASEGLALYWCTREAICREEKVQRGLGVRDFLEKEGRSYVCMESHLPD